MGTRCACNRCLVAHAHPHTLLPTYSDATRKVRVKTAYASHGFPLRVAGISARIFHRQTFVKRCHLEYWRGHLPGRRIRAAVP